MSEYAGSDCGAFFSGVSSYSTKSKSSSHIKPNEASPGGGSKSTNRPYGSKAPYEKGMSKGKNSAQQ